MYLKVEVNCEDELQAINHLHVVAHEVRKHLKKYPDANDREGQDNNCYGDHTWMVRQDVPVDVQLDLVNACQELLACSLGSNLDNTVYREELDLLNKIRALVNKYNENPQ